MHKITKNYAQTLTQSVEHRVEELTLNSSMPQGSWLRPFSFIVIIDGLMPKPSCPTHKYMDDTTLTEIL